MTVNTGDNRYGPPIYLVDPTAGNGTHTTISAAVTAANTAAVSNVTIFVRPGTYSGNFTPTVAMTITVWTGDGIEGNVIITGTVTVSSAITVTLSNVQLQTNSANILVVSGSSASIVNLKDCYFNCTNNTGISFTTSSASAQINILYCTGDLGTTGISFLSSSSAGTVKFLYCEFTNSGSSLTATTNSAGSVVMDFVHMFSVVSCTSTGLFTASYCYFQCQTLNTIAAILNGTSGNNNLYMCKLSSGTASCLSIGAGATTGLEHCSFTSANTNAITGSGLLNFSSILFDSTSSTINTSSLGAYTTGVEQINFYQATGSTGTPTSNLMKFYEEGTWTPTIAGSSTAGTPTYTVQNGLYIRIGSMVTVWFDVAYSAISGSPAGDLTLGGLPFTSSSSTNYFASGCGVTTGGATWPASHTMFIWQIGTSATTAVAASLESAGSQSNIQIASGNFVWRGTITYHT